MVSLFGIGNGGQILIAILADRPAGNNYSIIIVGGLSRASQESRTHDFGRSGTTRDQYDHYACNLADP